MYRVEDVVESAAGGKVVVRVDSLQATDGEKHSNGRTKCEKGLRVEHQLRVIDGDLKRVKQVSGDHRSEICAFSIKERG